MRRLLLPLLACVAAGFDYYRELGVSRRASDADIKGAYRKLAKMFHPDKNKADGAEARFQRIATAHETLSDPEKRRLYDAHGEDYASISKRRAQQQRDHIDPYSQHRRQPQAPPIFSSTYWITADNYTELVEESADIWLLQFYHDWSEPCKSFAPRWEALAQKLPPMVMLGRVNLDQNIGLMQRYRNFLRCRQSAFSLQCSAPALVLVTNSADGSQSAQTYHGHHTAEAVYEWLKRALPGRRSGVSELKPTESAIRSFLAPPWTGYRTRKANKMKRDTLGRLACKSIIFSSSRSASDTLLVRHLSTSLEGALSVASVYVAGGLTGANTDVTRFLRQHKISELPAIALWPEGAETPSVIPVGTNSDGPQRAELLARIGAALTPSVPLLSAANYHSTCAAPSWDENRLCVLLLVRLGKQFPDEAIAAIEALREIRASSSTDLSAVRFAWVDADRQDAFVRHVLGSNQAEEETLLIALRVAPRDHRMGLHRLEVARSPRGVAELVARRTALEEWLRNVHVWNTVRGTPPPLRMQREPSPGAKIRVWFFHSGGWLLMLLLGGGGGALAYFWGDVLKWVKKQQAQAQQETRRQAPPKGRPQQQEQQGQKQQQQRRQPEEPSQRASPEGLGVRALTPSSVSSIVEGSPYVLIYVTNAGVADLSSMRKLMASFGDFIRHEPDAFRQWSQASLDLSTMAEIRSGSPELLRIAERARQSVCAVLRRRSKIVLYQGAPHERALEEWIGRLRMGELSWNEIAEDAPPDDGKAGKRD